MATNSRNFKVFAVKDIESKEDITTVLTHFYEQLLNDPITKPIFEGIDINEHIPVIADFWAMVLLGDMTYKGNPFSKHIDLGLKKEHFERWLHHFEQSISDDFAGEKVDLAKQRAHSIAFIFQSKLPNIDT